MQPIFEIKGIPLSSLILMDTQEEAKAFPRGDLQLVVCTECGFIFNMSFRPEVVDYTLPYESSQDFSPRFRQFKQELIDHLINSYDIKGKEVLEIGCGDASFLEALCHQADAKGFGIDPTFDPTRLSADAAVSGIQDFYNVTHVDLTADLICCRHTLEHVQPVGEFVDLVRQSAVRTTGSVVFFEIPDTDRILEEGAFWDVYYEHCSYFTLPSLANLFRSRGFEVLRLKKGYDDQYLLIDSVVSSPNPDFDKSKVRTVVDRSERFRDAAATAIRGWSDLIAMAADSGRTVALWGASSKAVAFLASVDVEDSISVAVDINPFKQNKYLPGSGLPVIGPETLPTVAPDLVIVMNPIYVPEIRQTLDDLELHPEIHALGVDNQ
ncbi:MAG: class I SAM-dependent methyltransferase [Acidimicrobiia bacterium]